MAVFYAAIVASIKEKKRYFVHLSTPRGQVDS